MNKKTAVCLCLGAGLLAAAAWQVHRIEQYGSRYFLDNTIINGVDCSAMTVEEAADELTGRWNEHTFVIEQDGEQIGEIDNLDFSYSVEKQLKAEQEIPLYQMVWRYITGKEERINVKMKIEKNTQSFTDQINSLKFLNKKYTVKTKDAYIDLSDRNFTIVKEVQGDNIDKSKFESEVMSRIEDGEFTLDYREEDYYAVPEVTSSDEELLEYREYCQTWLSQKITYQFYDGTYQLTPKQLNRMISVEDGERKVNRKAVKRFVEELAASHNTVGRVRSFPSVEKGYIRVSGGNYGYIIDEDAEIKALTKDLQSGEDVTRKPEYSQQPYYTGEGSSDIGYSYVEIDLSSQKLWMFKGGKKIVSCRVVTGNVADGFATPAGVYYLSYKSRDAVLRGSNKDGSKYETPVEYWMPFNQGIGMHDAYWRSDFGGKIYRKSGSHGCINMPPDSAAAVYENITAGYPIVVHH